VRSFLKIQKSMLITSQKARNRLFPLRQQDCPISSSSSRIIIIIDIATRAYIQSLPHVERDYHLIISNTAAVFSSHLCLLIATLHNPQSLSDCNETLQHLKIEWSQLLQPSSLYLLLVLIILWSALLASSRVRTLSGTSNASLWILNCTEEQI
jgi:hypothetical protein